jgi:hypothetical protein
MCRSFTDPMPHTLNFELTQLSPSLIRCEILRDILFTEAIAREIYDDCNSMMNGKYCILWVMKKNLSPDTGVMSFFASKERSKRVNAEAFCMESHALKLTANFYFRIKKPIVRGKAFDNEEDALHWLSPASGL